MSKVASVDIRRLPISELRPHPRNPRNHPEPGSSRWDVMSKSLTHDYFDPLVWNERNKMLVSGHFRTKVLQHLGYTEVDVVVVNYDETTHYARLIAANRSSGIDDEDMLRDLITDLNGFDLGDISGMIGMDSTDLSGLFAITTSDLASAPPAQLTTASSEGQPQDTTSNDKPVYTRRVGSPVYTPTKEVAPNLSECYTTGKTDTLIARISKSSASPELKAFLTAAAHRHTVFNYEQIAELYAHASVEDQRLMEESALVIIDFKSAIEGGYVAMSEEIRQQYLQDSSKPEAEVVTEKSNG